VVINFSSLITAINMDSDVSIALVLGKLLGSAPAGAHVVLGDHPWYEPLWFLRATSWLPGYRFLWDVAPALWTLAGIGILAWSTSRALGRWAAALTAAALVCFGTAGRLMFFSLDWHGPTALHVVLLGAMMVWLVERAERLQGWQIAAVVVVMGAISALPVTGDRLFLYWGILPMILTGVLLVWRTRDPAHWRTLGIAGGVAAVALAGGALLHHAMLHRGWTSVPFAVGFAVPGALATNVELLIQAYTNLAGGTFFGGLLNATDAAALVSGGLVILAAVCLPFELRRRAGGSAPAPVPMDPMAARRFVYVTFWSASLAIASLVFVLSDSPVDANSARYVLAGYIAIGALLPLLALRSRGWQATVTAGVCLFALVASYQVIRQPFQPQLNAPTPQEATALARFAKSEDVGYGYAGYWDAADLTWMSKFGLKVYPVAQCLPPTLSICPYNIGVSSWYALKRHTRSMLILDHKIQIPQVAAADPAFGHPLITANIGNLTAYVYPFDIAQRFQGTPPH
jgi:hypothetical protein